MKQATQQNTRPDSGLMYCQTKNQTLENNQLAVLNPSQEYEVIA